MDDIQSRYEELKRIHAEMSAMPDAQMEHVEALGEEIAELLHDAAAALSELPPTATSATTEMALRVVAQLTEALTALDEGETNEQLG